ncbi:MAG TPA: DUF2059 domain-containing protein [Rhizomicrobium sp.]|jgi:hypothetical protein|nr:DUF2059 domain-containing protein [Rhizomicrobium sp.]
MKLMALALVSLFVSGSAAHATGNADVPASPACMKDGTQVPDDYLQLADEVMTASKATDRITLLLDAMIPAIMPLAHKALPDISDAQFAELQVSVRDEMMKSLPILLSAEACLYVKHFSRDDLSALVAFYKSPLGQKLITESPALIKESLPLGKAWGEQAGRAALERVIARYRNKGDHA